MKIWLITEKAPLSPTRPGACSQHLNWAFSTPAVDLTDGTNQDKSTNSLVKKAGEI